MDHSILKYNTSILARHGIDIHSVSAQVSLMKYPILSLRYYWISWTQNKYPFYVCTDQTDRISNMISTILSYQPNTQYILYRRIRCILSGYSVSVSLTDTPILKYDMNVLAGHGIDIHSVSAQVSLMKYPILSLLYYQISRTQNEYPFRVCTDQPDQISNMISTILLYQANT